MVARAQEAVHPVDPSPNRVAVRPPPIPIAALSASAASGKRESIVRRATAIGALGWLGYIGYLLRDCPSSGLICQSSFATSAALVALGLVLLGHVAGLAVRSLEGRLHAH